MANLVIASDFDGTISRQDSLRIFLEHFAVDTWPLIRSAWKRGEISERQALEQVFEQIDLTQEEAEKFVLERVRLDPSFSDFLDHVRSEGWDIRVLSGGINIFIEALLRTAGLKMSFDSNRVEIHNRKWKFFPKGNGCEEFGHCKCESISETNPEFLIYIGDGVTDFCPAEKADLVFAKGELARYLHEKKIPFQAWDFFSDIQAKLTLSDFDFSRRSVLSTAKALE